MNLDRVCATNGKLNSEHAGMNLPNDQDPAVDLRVTNTLSQVGDAGGLDIDVKKREKLVLIAGNSMNLNNWLMIYDFYITT